jgi:predicted transcriptional regulator
MKKKSKAKVVASCKIQPKTKAKLEQLASQRGQTFSEVLARVVEEYEEPTTDELEERAKLVGQIVSGLEVINASEWSEDDLEATAKTVGGIVSGLEVINASDMNDDDLEAMAKQTAEIVSNLKTIEESEVEVG